ncbi:MAG: ribonuclease III [Actinomycetia bacterium]|nr:ribonuclease III [Actinomycetes bacterium]
MPRRAVPPTGGGSSLLELLGQLGVAIDPGLMELATIHRSYAYENGQIQHNERLEFLGDAVLGVVVTEYLYRAFPEAPEGRLAKLRAAVVSSASLAEVARDLGIGRLVKLGKGESATGGQDKTSILADMTEAMIGAMYLTSPDGARTFIRHLFIPLIEHAATLGAGLDWKTSLQEACSELGSETPSYVVDESGPDHQKQFQAHVRVGLREFPGGSGRSKKQAEQEAARRAYEAIRTEIAIDATSADDGG